LDSPSLRDENVVDRTPHNDKPILTPSEDRFGIDPFAKTLASSIRKLASPEGTVIALNGPWGSGKSSAVNLVLHHLKDAIETNEIAVINFACWWFRGEEELALAFFRELYAGLGATLGDRFKRVLPKIGARLLRAGAMVGPGIDLAGGGGGGAVAAGAMNWLSGLIQQDDTVEKLHAELAKALADQKKRFLIVIDDIDRLAPDEALLIFRLVKSVGRLPNMIYLLVFDRQLAENIVAEKYPTEGPHYLEKIIQAGFDIPEPRQDDLRQELLEILGELCGSPNPNEDGVRFMNIFYDVVAPEIKMPRDLIRLGNSLAVTWPAVGNDVDRADFIGVEVLRVLRPNVYRALRANKERLCGVRRSMAQRPQQQQRDEYNKHLLGSVSAQDQERLQRALMRLFPPLSAIWSNVVYGEHSMAEWSRERRVCASDHFDSYFRFSLGGDVLPKDKIDQLVARASDQEFIVCSLREGLTAKRSSGGTKAALMLDELNLHADKVADDDVQPLLTAIFKIADELDVPSDAAKAFSIGDNNLRIHWLLRRLTLERFDLARRSAVFMAACETAALNWLADFASSTFHDYHPREGKEPEPESRCLTTEADTENLRGKILLRIRAAAESGELGAHPKLGYLLYRWRDLADDDGVEVKRWTDGQLEQDGMIVKFAKALTSHGWSQSVSDTVAQRTTLANISGLEVIMDKDRLRARVEELAAGDTLPEAEAGAVLEFLEAWRRHDRNERG
jgi:predicted KAP-like P-loop ATPase